MIVERRVKLKKGNLWLLFSYIGLLYKKTKKRLVNINYVLFTLLCLYLTHKYICVIRVIHASGFC